MSEIQEFEKFHPRAIKLFRKKKNFLVISEDEQYYTLTYAMIRAHEFAFGTWTEEDEKAYKQACGITV